MENNICAQKLFIMWVHLCIADVGMYLLGFNLQTMLNI